jgi:hypothetical protein
MDQQPSPGETDIVVKPSQVNNVHKYSFDSLSNVGIEL